MDNLQRCVALEFRADAPDGCLEAREPQSPPFAERLEHFAACMREQRELSERTICHRCWHARQLLMAAPRTQLFVI
jgi:hypothetical protein